MITTSSILGARVLIVDDQAANVRMLQLLLSDAGYNQVTATMPPDFLSKPLDMTEVLTRIRNMLELRLMYRQLALHNSQLEATVLERTQELRESEARFRSLTELATDWYWAQDEIGPCTKVSGPVLEMLGIQVDALTDGAPEDAKQAGWNEAERAVLRTRIAAREPFLDSPFSRQQANGVRQQFRVSGQPTFDRTCRFIGYRGVGVEVLPVSP